MKVTEEPSQISRRVMGIVLGANAIAWSVILWLAIAHPHEVRAWCNAIASQAEEHGLKTRGCSPIWNYKIGH